MPLRTQPKKPTLAGFLKLSASDATGGRHIVRFLIPGDAVGLDAGRARGNSPT